MNRPAPLLAALGATGFLLEDEPAPGLVLEPSNLDVRTSFRPDAIWRDRSHLEVVFKYADRLPSPRDVASWHRDVWNLGVAPLLWVVSPERIDLYNTYERPLSAGDASSHLLRQFRLIDRELANLDDYAGRLAMASGGFWSHEEKFVATGELMFNYSGTYKKLSGSSAPMGCREVLRKRYWEDAFSSAT